MSTPTPTVTADPHACPDGWTDSSQFTPSFMSHNFSRVDGNWLCFVTIYTDGKVRWGVQPGYSDAPRPTERSHHGPARDVAHAVAACAADVAARESRLPLF